MADRFLIQAPWDFDICSGLHQRDTDVKIDIEAEHLSARPLRAQIKKQQAMAVFEKGLHADQVKILPAKALQNLTNSLKYLTYNQKPKHSKLHLYN